MNTRLTLLVSAALLSAVGCISVKTESEIKPIHITMDVNLKVDRELDKAFAEENMKQPKGNFSAVKSLLDRKVAGVSNKALLEARAGATDDDKITIAEANARKLKRMNEIAKSSGVALEAVQQRSAKKFQAKIPAGSGVWIQDESGTWSQK
jgi:hypothetical protein